MHPFRSRRGLAALASLFAVAALAAPAQAATYRADIVTSITDPKGDVTDEDDAPLTEARADVTTASVEYRPGEIGFGLNVAQPSDPRTDANWVDGDTFALWAIDTNADQEADFLVTLVNVDGVLGVVVLNPDLEPLCFGSGTFDGLSYGAVIPSSCVGNPATFGWGAGIFYAMADGTVAVDGAPDGDNLAGPIQAPLPLDPTAGGYWLVGDDGGIFGFNALFAGSTGAIKLNKPIVGMAANSKGKGYWFVASDGGIFSFGDAKFWGSTGSVNLNKPIVGMTATPSGQGYWLVASDGGIFSFGDAKFYGSTGAMTLSQPIVGMASTGTGAGYWFVAADGGIFSFGDAKFHGAAVGSSFPVVGMATTRDGKGYSIVRADGSVVNRGSAPLAGSLVGHTLSRPIVGIAATL